MKTQQTNNTLKLNIFIVRKRKYFFCKIMTPQNCINSLSLIWNYQQTYSFWKSDEQQM
jgi:hypothetical protein